MQHPSVERLGTISDILKRIKAHPAHPLLSFGGRPLLASRGCAHCVRITMAESPFESELRVDFSDPHNAELVHSALVVDPELRPGEVQRVMSVEGSELKVKFEAKQLRMLRAATGAFMDLLGVAVDTLEAFKEDIQQ